MIMQIQDSLRQDLNEYEELKNFGQIKKYYFLHPIKVKLYNQSTNFPSQIQIILLSF